MAEEEEEAEEVLDDNIMLDRIKKDLNKLGTKKRAEASAWFFKTGKGEYGEGDVFLGLTSQEIKDVSKKYLEEANFNNLQKLLNSKIHEYRIAVLRILIEKYQKADEKDKKKIFNFYLKNTKHINNWDLVDISAPNIVGDYLLSKDKKILYKLAKSKNLWERRISIISTFRFIRENQFKDTLKISEILLNDEHDLIHKAVGWMLREIGKRDQKAEEKFLKKYYKTMPRTMLRYAIEKFEENKRKSYLKK